MSSLSQHLYAYKRGVRRLVLHTTKAVDRHHIETKLTKEAIPFLIVSVSPEKINVFFGDRVCVEVVRSIGKRKLSDYTAEEDFLLGAMLGYDMVRQCDRYLKRKQDHRRADDRKQVA